MEQGRLRKLGLEILKTHSLELYGINRIGLILGTGWSNPKALKNSGFVMYDEISFEDVGLIMPGGAGHPNRFLIGAWHGKQVVISQGRVHLYQERVRAVGTDSLMRRWMAVLLALMGDGDQLIIASAVGGLQEHTHQGTLIQPSEIHSADIPADYLTESGEFFTSEHLLWPAESDPIASILHLSREESTTFIAW